MASEVTFGMGLVVALTSAGLAVPGAVPHSVSDRLARDNAESQAALLRGDVDTFVRKAGGLAKDFVLMSPFGGKPSVASDYTPERMARMGRFFRNGTLRQDVVARYESRDMVVLATIEHADVEVGGLASQHWALRVTSVFVRRDGRWQLAHRHADPLVADVSLQQSAALARGERMAAD